MRVRKGLILFSIMISATVAFSQPSGGYGPVLWVYGANHGAPYSGIEITDTQGIAAPFAVWHPGFGIDTNIEELHQNGTSFNDSIVTYFSYDYQFTDSVLWSGFKLMWEEHGFTWDIRGYDSIAIRYVGPLPQHKVDITLGEGFDPYAQPEYLEYLGSLPANTPTLPIDSLAAWKRYSIPIPPAPDSSDRYYLREIRFMIHDTGSVSQASGVGNFSFMEVSFVVSNKSLTVNAGAGGTVRPSGHVTVYKGFADTIVATPAAGDSFVRWTRSGTGATIADSTKDTTTVTLTDDATVTAQFSSTTTAEPPEKEKSKCGCGSGTGLALLPPIWFKVMSNRRRKKKNRDA